VKPAKAKLMCFTAKIRKSRQKKNKQGDAKAESIETDNPISTVREEGEGEGAECCVVEGQRLGYGFYPGPLNTALKYKK
jgi:hypothetical protein